MLLKIRLLFLRPFYFIRKHILNYLLKSTHRYPQRKKYDQILNTLKIKSNIGIDTLFTEISGEVLKRDYDEIPKAGRYATTKRHYIFDSIDYLKDSCQYLQNKNYIAIQNNKLSITPSGNMFLEDKRGFVEELIVSNFDESLIRWGKTLSIATAIIAIFFGVKNLSDFLKSL